MCPYLYTVIWQYTSIKDTIAVVYIVTLLHSTDPRKIDFQVPIRAS